MNQKSAGAIAFDAGRRAGQADFDETVRKIGDDPDRVQKVKALNAAQAEGEARSAACHTLQPSAEEAQACKRAPASYYTGYRTAYHAAQQSWLRTHGTWRVYRTQFHGGGLISTHHEQTTANRELDRLCKNLTCKCGCYVLVPPGEMPAPADVETSPYRAAL